MHTVPEETVAEIQGYYGSISIAEKVTQQLWEHQDFDVSNLETQEGEKIVILDPGKLNHNEGPDFKGAVIRIGDKEAFSGDVELHLYPNGWIQHQHARDPNFKNVILHVTLFDGVSPKGRNDPRNHLVLLPHLNSDLEELLTQSVFRNISKKPALLEAKVSAFMGGAVEDDILLREKIHEKAKLRWNLKKQFAGKRLAEVGWSQACHQLMLEVLGYSRNRAVMHKIAVAEPLTLVKPNWMPRSLFDAHRSEWKLKGSRPANHPLKRLESYHRILLQQPDWPRNFLFMAHQFLKAIPQINEAGLDESVSSFRKQTQLLQWVERVKSELFLNEIGGTRFHTLFCDALLPLLSVSTERERWQSVWFAWPAGDYPAEMMSVSKLLRLHLGGREANSNGCMQACMQFILELDPAPDREG